MLRRTAVIGMFLAAFMGLSSVGAMAAPSEANNGQKGERSCAEGGFTVMTTTPFAEAMSVDSKGNANGLACVKINNGSQVVAVDDREGGSL
jgi:hypothetical protein